MLFRNIGNLYSIYNDAILWYYTKFHHHILWYHISTVFVASCFLKILFWTLRIIWHNPQTVFCENIHMLSLHDTWELVSSCHVITYHELYTNMAWSPQAVGLTFAYSNDIIYAPPNQQWPIYLHLPRYQSSWDQHGAHLGHVGPRWAPCWPYETCYQG